MADNVFTNNSGSLFRLRNNSTLNISEMTSMSSGDGSPTFVLESGSTLNIVGGGSISSSGAPIFQVTDSKINVSGVDQLQTSDASTVVAENSSVILSNIRSVGGLTPISLRGTCHVTLNRVTDFLVSGEDNVFLACSGTNYGSLKIQNMALVPGSIQTANMNVTLSSVRVVRSSGVNPSINFTVDSADGNYTLIIEGPTSLLTNSELPDRPDSLYMLNSVGKFNGVVCDWDVGIVNSVVDLHNSSFTATSDVSDSTFTAVRTLFDTLLLSNSHCTVKNSTVLDLTPANSSVVSYHSEINGNIEGTANSAVWLHNSRVGGDATMSGGSSLVGSAATLEGAGSADAGFIGVYGGVFGTVTTANRGMALAFGSSAGSIDGALDVAGNTEQSNVLSAEGGLSLRSGTLHIQTVSDAHLHVGKDWQHSVVGTSQETYTGLYKATITSTYDIDATGIVTIKSLDKVKI